MTATIASVKLESVEYDLKSETYRGQYDRDTTSASMAVIAALADVTGRDPTELEPLHASVDPDALDALLSGRETTDGDVSVTFTIANHAITVSSDGVVAIDSPGHDRADDPNEGLTQMTTEETSLTTRAELNAEMKSLLRRAHTNGIDVEGGWECRNGAEHPDWDVIVTEVQKNEGSDGTSP